MSVFADGVLCLAAQAQAQKQKMSAKVQKKFAKRIGGSGGATNGLSSTVAFTPLQVCPLTTLSMPSQVLNSSLLCLTLIFLLVLSFDA